MYKYDFCGVYQISSKTNTDRVYVGSSVNVKKRLLSHKSELSRNIHKTPKLQRHYNKYGVEDLSFSIIEIFPFISMDHLEEREQYHIDNIKPWFNAFLIVNHLKIGTPKSEETRLKISKALKGKKRTEEQKKHLSEVKKNDPATLEQIKKLAEINKGNKYNIGNNWNKGRKHTEEAKKKISKGKKGTTTVLKGTHQSPEHIKKRADANRGKKQSDIAKKHMKEAQKLYSKTHPNSKIGRKHSEETKRKMSLAKKNNPKTLEHIKKLAENRRKK